MSLNAGFARTATLGAEDSFCRNLETQNPALDSQAGSPEMLLPWHPAGVGSQPLSGLLCETQFQGILWSFALGKYTYALKIISLSLSLFKNKPQRKSALTGIHFSNSNNLANGGDGDTAVTPHTFRNQLCRDTCLSISALDKEASCLGPGHSWTFLLWRWPRFPSTLP